MARGERSEDNPRRKITTWTGSLDLATGDLYDSGGKPVAGPAAKRAAQEQKLAAENKAWEEWHADYEDKRYSEVRYPGTDIIDKEALLGRLHDEREQREKGA